MKSYMEMLRKNGKNDKAKDVNAVLNALAKAPHESHSASQVADDTDVESVSVLLEAMEDWALIESDNESWRIGDAEQLLNEGAYYSDSDFNPDDQLWHWWAHYDDIRQHGRNQNGR